MPLGMAVEAIVLILVSMASPFLPDHFADSPGGEEADQFHLEEPVLSSGERR